MTLYFSSSFFFLFIDPCRVSNDDKDVKARGIIEALKRDMAMLYDALCGTSYERVYSDGRGKDRRGERNE